MEFKYYESGDILETSSSLRSNCKTFHIEFIEALNSTTLSTENETILLNPLDIVISKHFKKVHVSSQENPAVRWFSVELRYPAPLNQYLVADNALIHDLMNIKNQEVDYIVFRNLDLKICHNYLDNLQTITQQKDQDQYFEFQTQAITGLLFTELLHKHRQKIAKSVSRFPSTDVKYASRDSQSGAIMTYLAMNNGNVTLQQMADHFGYQKNYLSRLCKKLFDLDFVHLRLNIRMNLASERLRLTNMSVNEISDELGYKESSTFIQNFIKAKKMTPAKYRNQFQQKYKTENAHPSDP